MQVNYGENEIKTLLQKVRIFNNDIGAYQVFAITEHFDYTVKLSNGKILIKLEDLQDDEHNAMTPERLTTIAKRYIPLNSQATIQNQVNHGQQESKKQSEKKKSGFNKTFLIIAIAIIVIIVGFAIFQKLNSSGSYGASDSYNEKVMTIEEIERSQPTTFLSADGAYRENFWGDKMKVKCVITNRATVASFKDAVVRITYYTKTKTELGSKDYTIYEVFPPNSTKTVDMKIDNYKNVNNRYN